MFKFGDIYFIQYPDKNFGKKIKPHLAVILFCDKKTNRVYYQTLTSRIYKVFPNFGSIANKNCPTCTLSWDENNHTLGSLHPDESIILDYKKYKNFLNKETFFCLRRLMDSPGPVFEEEVRQNINKYRGRLSEQNRKNILVALRYMQHYYDENAIKAMLTFAEKTW